MALRYLVFWPLDQWQVDVEVYREAGVSLLTGRPVYSAMTETPQLLPFTYPPFAAILALPLALVPFGVVGWLWTAAQVAATTAIVWYAGWRLIHRHGTAAPLVLALLTAPMLWLHPVSDGIRFGQVNAFMVLACLMDLRRPRPRLLRRIPAGRAGRPRHVDQAHARACSSSTTSSTAAGARPAGPSARPPRVTLGTFLLLPEASFAFWGGALQDPNRLGPNGGTSNQSLRGFLLRVGPQGAVGTALWLACVVVVGRRRLRDRPTRLPPGRLDQRGRRRRADGGAALARRVDPPPALDGRGGPRHPRRRPAGATAAGCGRRAAVHRLVPLPRPVVGHHLGQPATGSRWLIGRFLQNSDTFGALMALGLLGWALRRTPGSDAPDRGAPASTADGLTTTDGLTATGETTAADAASVPSSGAQRTRATP